jgi:hypothetical protein
MGRSVINALFSSAGILSAQLLSAPNSTFFYVAAVAVWAIGYAGIGDYSWWW